MGSERYSFRRHERWVGAWCASFSLFAEMLPGLSRANLWITAAYRKALG
ncbi:hypothetical protein [Paraburkholderia sp. DHOC27]|nr:hypothetical protein [Paraburkholderia sp. DHOC27]